MTGRAQGGGMYDPGLPELLRKASGAYRRHDDPAFRAHMEEAVVRTPHRIDLRVCLANHCVQTGQPEQALDIFEELTRLVPRDADVLFCLAHWRRYAGETGGAEQARRQLAKIRSERAADLARLWQCIDSWILREPSRDLPELPSGAGRKAIVLPGYVLAEDGSMRRELLERLEKTLEAAEAYPGACVVVSGGVPKAGRVEAVVMAEWLRGRGIADDRIYEEGYSRDLVENAVYSRQILDLLDVEAVLVVNSAGNFRRSGAVFEILAHTCGSAWSVGVAAASGGSFDAFVDDGGDALKLYRDALRAYGMPMMAAYPELSER
jgi:hypothetical protein